MSRVCVLTSTEPTGFISTRFRTTDLTVSSTFQSNPPQSHYVAQPMSQHGQYPDYPNPGMTYQPAAESQLHQAPRQMHPSVDTYNMSAVGSALPDQTSSQVRDEALLPTSRWQWSSNNVGGFIALLLQSHQFSVHFLIRHAPHTPKFEYFWLILVRANRQQLAQNLKELSISTVDCRLPLKSVRLKYLCLFQYDYNFQLYIEEYLQEYLQIYL